jgi:small ligand-binding sensory domain FIST
VAFHAALRSAHINFVAKLEAQARSLLQHHLDTATSEFALSMMAAMPDVQYGQQQQHVSRRATAASADDTENMPPEEAEDQQQMQVGALCWSCSGSGSMLHAPDTVRACRLALDCSGQDISAHRQVSQSTCKN